MNTKYTIKNFRIFDEEGATIDLKPLTILTGCNSAGKSSITKAVLFLSTFFSQIREDKKSEKPIRLDSYAIDFTKPPFSLLGNFDNVINRNSKSQQLTFEYTVHSYLLSEDVIVSFVFDLGIRNNNGLSLVCSCLPFDDFAEKREKELEDRQHNVLKKAYLQTLEIRTLKNQQLYCSSAKSRAEIIEPYTKEKCSYSTYDLSLFREKYATFISSEQYIKKTEVVFPYYYVGNYGRADIIMDKYSDMGNFEGLNGAVFYDVFDESEMFAKEWNKKSKDFQERVREVYRYKEAHPSFSLEEYVGRISLAIDDDNVRTKLAKLKDNYNVAVIDNNIKNSIKKCFLLILSSFENAWNKSGTSVSKYFENLLTKFLKNYRFESLPPTVVSERASLFGCIRDDFGLKDWKLTDDEENFLGFLTAWLFIISGKIKKEEKHVKENDPRERRYLKKAFGGKSLDEVLNEFSNSDSSKNYSLSDAILRVLPIFDVKQNIFAFWGGLEKFAVAFVNEVLLEEAPIEDIQYVSSSKVDVQRVYNLEKDDEFVHTLKKYYETESTSFHIAFINKWLRQFGIGDRISLEMDEDATIAKIRLYKSKKDEKGVLLADEGYGVTQLVALLMRIVTSNTRETIIIEEPEIHLHPKFQSLLADMFLDAHEELSVDFIIETHSEYLIRRSQVLVAQKKYKDKEYLEQNNPFVVYYVPENHKPYDLVYRTDGKFEKEFGPGFYDVASDLAFELF